MESIFDAPMNDGCNSSDCPVHFRNDHHGQSEDGSDFWISYVGKYAVYSGIDVRHDIDPQEAMDIAKESMMALLTKGGQASEEIALKAYEGFTYLYEVGDGAIMDCPTARTGGVERWYGSFDGDDVLHRHQMVKDLAKVMGL